MIPQACARLCRAKRIDAVIALGAVVRGATAHVEYVAGEVSRGVAAGAIETGVPIAFGVITCDTLEQAIERAGNKAGNEGFDAALTAIEMVNQRAWASSAPSWGGPPSSAMSSPG